jgi:hypothetical protein
MKNILIFSGSTFALAGCSEIFSGSTFALAGCSEIFSVYVWLTKQSATLAGCEP